MTELIEQACNGDRHTVEERLLLIEPTIRAELIFTPDGQVLL